MRFTNWLESFCNPARNIRRVIRRQKNRRRPQLQFFNQFDVAAMTEKLEDRAMLSGIPTFMEQTGAANPLNGVDIGARSTPSLGDLDGDGDLDLFSGKNFGTFSFFENTGTALAPVFTEQTGAANPLNGLGVGSNSTPTLGDVDGDGDLDLFAGNLNGTFKFFENTGTALAPVFTEQTGAANPLNGVDIGGSSTPTLGDVDGDGDLDLFSGESGGTFRFFENTGTALAPAFTEQTGADNPLNGAGVGYINSLTLGDVDGDGDLDLFAGELFGTFSFFENTGTALAPVFTQRTGAANPLNGVPAGSVSTPTLGDVDGDGDLDLFSGDNSGTFRFFEATTTPAVPAFNEQTGAANPLDGFDIGDNSTTTLGDIDGDGDLDLFTGVRYDGFRFFQNTGTAIAPAFTEQTGAANPLNGLAFGLSSTPTLGDLDGDGDLDLFTGTRNGLFGFFLNTGTATVPAFTEQTGGANPLNGVDVDWGALTLGDLDGDGDLDLFTGGINGAFRFFQNIGSATAPAFTEQTGAANPLNGVAVGSFSRPTLGDLDGDGDLDLVTGARDDGFRFFQNTGTAIAPAFAEQTGAANPLNGVTGADTTPTLGDLDGDGDLDLVSGESFGTFRFFEAGVAAFSANADLSVTTQGNESGPTNIVYTVTLDTPNTTGSAITFEFDDLGTGTADSGDDYTAISGTAQISIANNASTGTITVPVIDDRRVEGDETVVAQISNASDVGVTITTASATATISDDDTATYSFASATSAELENNATSADIDVTLTLSTTGSGTIGLDRSVVINVNEGASTATNGTDFSYTNQTVTFNTGDGTSFTQNVTVDIIEDIVDDDAETVILGVTVNTDNTGGQVTTVATPDATHTLTITDDDSAAEAVFDIDPAVAGPFTVQRSGGNIEIRDGGNNLVASAVAGASGLLTLNGTAGDDIFIINLAAGSLAADIEVNGGAEGANGDTLVVEGDGANDEATYTPHATITGNGTVDFDLGGATGTITFTGLEPVDMSGFAVATLVLPGGDDVLFVDGGFDDATGLIPALIVSGTTNTGAAVAIEQVHFFNNGEVVIDTTGTDGNDTITIGMNTAANNTHGNDDLTIDTGTGTDAVDVVGALSVDTGGDITISTVALTISANVTTTSGGDYDLDATTITIDSGATVSTTGNGEIVADAVDSIDISGSSTLQTATGQIALTANAGVGTGDFTGISINNSDLTATSGTITLTGTGGNSAGNNGISLSNGATVITTGGSSGTIDFDGVTAGTGDGVLIGGTGTLVRSQTGAITITGTTAGRDGVRLEDSAMVVSTLTGIAPIDITGDTSGTGVGVTVDASIMNATGTVTIDSPDDSISFLLNGMINSAAGMVTIAADLGGADSGQVVMADGATVSGGTGRIDVDAPDDITLSELTTSGAVNVTTPSGDILDGGDSDTDVTGGAVSLSALNGAIGESAGGGAISLNTTSVTTTTATGGGDQFLTETGTTTWNTSSADTGNITLLGGRFNVGGGQTVTTAALTVETGATLGGTGTVSGPITANTGGRVSPGFSPGTLNTDSNLNLTAGSFLDIEFLNTTQGNAPGSHDRINVTGTSTVTLGATLNPSGSVAGTGQYVIIANPGTNPMVNPVIGTFAGIAEGDRISTDFLGSGQPAFVTYEGGDGNDVAITVGRVIVDNSVLIVNGTEERDIVSIQLSGANVNVISSFDGSRRTGITFAAAAITSIDADLKGGNDVYSIRGAFTVPVTILATGGSNRIFSSSSGDTVVMTSTVTVGNDAITTGNGNDIIEAGAGNNRINGRADAHSG